MKSSISRKDYHSTGAKIMRKLKGKGWVAASTGLAVLTGLSVVVAPIHAASPQSVESVLTSVLSSNFEEKADLVTHEAIKEESSKALDSVTTKWTANSIEAIKQEIQRQKDAGLDAYVIQWGDTLSGLAEATDQATIELGNLNGITNRDFIITGDVLIGVLEAEIRETTNNVPVQPVVVAPTPVTPSKPQQPSEPVIPTTPVTPEKPMIPVKPETPVVPETPVIPETPETPETPMNPETPANPEIPENPETPINPETPENPETPVNPEPETPENPETPVYTDVVIKEPVIEEAKQTVVSEEIIYDGKSGEEITTIAEGKYILSTDTIELSNETTPEVIGTETYTESVAEIIEVEEEVQVDEDENGEPIYETQLVEKATGNMIPVELTRETIISPASTTIISQTTTVYGIQFNVITQYDNTLDAGTEETVQEGIEGQSSAVITTTTVEGLVTTTTEPVETTLSAAQDKIIKVGTKEAVGSKKVVMNNIVTTRGLIHRTDPTLYEDEGQTIEGQDGFVNQKLEIITIGETSTETILEEASQEAISDIKIMGTKPVITTEKITVERPIAFETEYKEYPASDKKETIFQKGVNGLAIDTFLITYTKEVESNRELISSVVTLKPVTQIIQIGSITSDVYFKELITEDEIIPSPVEYYYVPTLTSSVPVLLEEGSDGLIRNHYEISYNNAGEEIRRILIGEERVNIPTSTVYQIGSALTETKFVEVDTIHLDDYNMLFHKRLGLTGYKLSPEYMTDIIEFIEDPLLATGEMIVEDEGSLGVRRYDQVYYNGEVIGSTGEDPIEMTPPRKRIVRIGTNNKSFTDDVINPDTIKWMDYQTNVPVYGDYDQALYDENGNPKTRIINVRIPDLNHYFKENARKFSSIDFSQDQLKAIENILYSADEAYKINPEFLYRSQGAGGRLKGQYYTSLFNKTSHYLELFNVQSSPSPLYSFAEPYHSVRFNEDDFEFELDLKPEKITTVVNPELSFEHPDTTLTPISSKNENGKLIETYSMVEKTGISPGYSNIKDPTKFEEELYEWNYGAPGLLTRVFEITKIDGVESGRKLVSYDLIPSQTSSITQGIRGGLRVSGGK